MIKFLKKIVFFIGITALLAVIPISNFMVQAAYPANAASLYQNGEILTYNEDTEWSGYEYNENPIGTSSDWTGMYYYAEHYGYRLELNLKNIFGYSPELFYFALLPINYILLDSYGLQSTISFYIGDEEIAFYNFVDIISESFDTVLAEDKLSFVPVTVHSGNYENQDITAVINIIVSDDFDPYHNPLIYLGLSQRFFFGGYDEVISYFDYLAYLKHLDITTTYEFYDLIIDGVQLTDSKGRNLYYNQWGYVGNGIFYCLDSDNSVLRYNPDTKKIISMSSGNACKVINSRLYDYKNQAIKSFITLDEAKTVYNLESNIYVFLDPFQRDVTADYQGTWWEEFKNSFKKIFGSASNGVLKVVSVLFLVIIVILIIKFIKFVKKLIKKLVK